MNAQELKDEIERLQKQLGSTPREFKVTVEFYMEATGSNEIHNIMVHIARVIREFNGASISFSYEEN